MATRRFDEADKPEIPESYMVGEQGPEYLSLTPQLELVVNDGPTLEAFLEQTYGINLLKSQKGLIVVDLKTKQMWSPFTRVVTDYGQNNT